MRRTYLAVAAAMLMLFLFAGLRAVDAAEVAKESPGGSEILTNKEIIEMSALDFDDDVVLEKIAASKCCFDSSLSALKVLKKARVADKVIAAMIRVGSNDPVCRVTASETTPRSSRTVDASGARRTSGDDALVELPFKIAEVKFWKQNYGMSWNHEFTGLKDLVRDDISIDSLLLSAMSARAGIVDYRIRVLLTNSSEPDKIVTLRFKVVSGDEVVGFADIKEIDAKDG